jgi:hypothetical protein
MRQAMAGGSLMSDELDKMIGVPSEPLMFKVEEEVIQKYAGYM